MCNVDSRSANTGLRSRAKSVRILFCNVTKAINDNVFFFTSDSGPEPQSRIVLQTFFFSLKTFCLLAVFYLELIEDSTVVPRFNSKCDVLSGELMEHMLCLTCFVKYSNTLLGT